MIKTEIVENMCGGKGHVIIKHILGEKELNGKCGLYAEVIIEPGCSLGYHEHHKESETYYILSGQGDYDDNGVVRPVKCSWAWIGEYRGCGSGVYGADYFGLINNRKAVYADVV